MGYNGPCAELHGHNYVAIIEFAGEYLDDIGFVIDFSDIKRYAKAWVDAAWDHATLLCSEDPLIEKLTTKTSKIYAFEKQNPTAEIMAEHLYDEIFKMLLENDQHYLKSVSIKEPETCEATYSPFA